jgi:CheY-like chemotaxis protein
VNDFDNVDILLVEDNASDAELTMRALNKGNIPFRLFWVKDGVEALEFIRCAGRFEFRERERELRVILLDLKMPRLDGLDVLRELKGDAHTKALPIVVMTSSNQERDIAEAYGLGVNGFVTKPVQLAEFSSVVASIGRFWLETNQAPAP